MPQPDLLQRIDALAASDVSPQDMLTRLTALADEARAKVRFWAHVEDGLRAHIENLTRLVLLALCVWMSGCALSTPPEGEPPIPFVSDGCSAPSPLLRVMFDRPEWRECCVTHDKVYWIGGTDTQRLIADHQFGVCLLEHGAPVQTVDTMYHTVRVFGGPHSEQPYRWGFGWPIHK